jgi:hypothetical protein
MSRINKLISVSEVVEAFRFDYRTYVMQRLADPRMTPVSMNTEFDHYPVMHALVTEVMTTGDDETAAGRHVVNAIMNQGVDISTATDMASIGLKRLVTEVASFLPGITFAQLQEGDMALCNTSDLMVSYSEKEEA